MHGPDLPRRFRARHRISESISDVFAWCSAGA